MGCPVSTSKPATDNIGDIAVENLTESQKNMIKTSWGSIQKDITRAGIIIFVRLVFKISPVVGH